MTGIRCDRPSRFEYVDQLAEQTVGSAVSGAELVDDDVDGFLLMAAVAGLVGAAGRCGYEGAPALETLQTLAAVRQSGVTTWPDAAAVAHEYREHRAAVRRSERLTDRGAAGDTGEGVIASDSDSQPGTNPG